MKTGQQIENDVYKLLRASTLSQIISGKVYKFGMRPRDSKVEDAVVKFVTGIPDQIHTGVVVVCIYVVDIAPWENGVFVRDVQRCEDLEVLACEWVSKLTTAVSDYKFRLSQTIYTEKESEINQHFVSVKLNYKILTD